MWNPNQYEKFKAERAQPFWDLVGMVQGDSIETILDLGCGTGELTAELHSLKRAKATLAIDNSAEMLEKAKAFQKEGLHFQNASIDTFQPPSSFELVFSNAALQWVKGHETLIPHVLSWVKDGGQVAIQVPANFDHPSHTVAKTMAVEMNLPQDIELPAVLPLERYSEILYANGFKTQRVLTEVYLHSLSHSSDVVEWTKGTLLTGYQRRLIPEVFKEFLERYRAQLVSILGDGPYAYPFKRIKIWGKK